MWIFSSKQSTWINLESVLRIGKDGNGEYIAVCSDNKKVTIDKETYEQALRWIDPEWYSKHPKGDKDSINIEEALKSIMKAVNAKPEKKEEEGD